MPADKPFLRPRALALVVVAGLGVSITPAQFADADEMPPRPAMVSMLSQVILSSSQSMSTAMKARPAVRQAGAPAPEVFHRVGRDVLADLAAAHAARMTPREQIAASCPDLDDSRLLRDGADGLGLCTRSVHQARTDVAAAAIVEGFGLLGLPYSRGRRLQDGYDDCSSFVGRSYRDAGNALSDSDWEPSSSVMRNASWAYVVDEPLPGDILWRRGHVAIALADGYQMHAAQSGDVTHVRTIGRYSRVLAVDPTRSEPIIPPRSTG